MFRSDPNIFDNATRHDTNIDLGLTPQCARLSVTAVVLGARLQSKSKAAVNVAGFRSRPPLNWSAVAPTPQFAASFTHEMALTSSDDTDNGRDYEQLPLTQINDNACQEHLTAEARKCRKTPGVAATTKRRPLGPTENSPHCTQRQSRTARSDERMRIDAWCARAANDVPAGSKHNAAALMCARGVGGRLGSPLGSPHRCPGDWVMGAAAAEASKVSTAVQLACEDMMRSVSSDVCRKEP